MVKILVASENPIKISATEDAFVKYFDAVDVLGVGVNSGVHRQPINDDVYKGAKNRSLSLKQINDKKKIDADYFVGIEEGLAELNGHWLVVGWVCILDIENNMSFGTTSCFALPKKVTKNLLNGIELGDEIGSLTGKKNSKLRDGAIGYFSHGVLNRKDLHIQAILMALVPFINKKLYND